MGSHLLSSEQKNAPLIEAPFPEWVDVILKSDNMLEQNLPEILSTPMFLGNLNLSNLRRNTCSTQIFFGAFRLTLVNCLGRKNKHVTRFRWSRSKNAFIANKMHVRPLK